ncbi:MAG TPA: hypothetical protein VET89_07075 [Stellaceae bacterium]|nr:hypothetical protein [Stellaceae bacterium]
MLSVPRRIDRSRRERRLGRSALAFMAAMTALTGAATPPHASVDIGELRRDRRMADELYSATTGDAAAFEKALKTPVLRSELERTLNRQLSDETLQAMASHARAEADYWASYRRGIDMAIGAEGPLIMGRRAPGRAPPSSEAEPIVNPAALPPPEPFERGGYVPVQDRWRILDALGRRENLLDPYNTNTLKADKPIFGEDWFVNVAAIVDILYEPARVPLGVGAQYIARPLENNTFGRYGRTMLNQTDILSVSLIKGDTAYKPPDLEFRLTPAFNFNHTDVGEIGVLNIDPAYGQTRNDNFIGLQEGFIDYHFRNVSEYYDFDSVRVGIQPFNADFRGFLFQDNQLGVRLFGDRDANRWQYNLAYFRRLEKDTNSGLNDIGQAVRQDGVFIANLFRQDFPVHGFTSQIAFLRNDNHEGGDFHFDKNGFLVRPSQIGDNRGYNYDANYLGFNGDGHFGRVNLTTSAYYLFGHLSHNQFGAPGNKGSDISAFFVAAEPSIDFDWARFRLSGLYASGARHPQSGTVGGFDAVFENPQFAGADSSFWIRQSIPLIGGGGVALNTPNGVLADLRSSKGEGQSNFLNPGIMLAGIGGDFDILPELRLSTNFNYLRFDTTAPLEFLRHQANIPNSIGWDLSAALTYRPLFTQNIVFRLSGAVLLPGEGTKALFNTPGGLGLFGNDGLLYSVLANVIVNY